MWKARWAPFVIAGLSLAIYLATACPWVLGGDSGEFATLAVTGGVAHPPGFPLYVLILRIASMIPGTSPAHAAALITAVFGALSVLGVGLASRRFGASPGASAIAAAAYASSAVSWRLATHAEAFAPAVFVGTMILLLSAREPSKNAARDLAELGFVAGLGLSTHTTLVLLFPIGALAVVRSLRACSSRGAALAAGILGLALGLSPYLYLWYSARAADPNVAWVWGDIHGFGDVVRHFLRSEYGTTRLGASDAAARPLSNVGRFLRVATVQTLGLPIVAFVLPFVVWFGKDPPQRRNTVFCLFLTFLTTGPLFVAAFNRPMTDIGPLIVERFYLLPFAVLAVLGAIALDRGATEEGNVVAVYATSVGAFVIGLYLSADRVREYSRPTLEDYVENVLSYVPPGTVILGQGDDKFGGFLYARLALAKRPDVSYVAPALLFSNWYREREGKRLGVSFPAPEGKTFRVAETVDRLLSAGHPVALAGFVARGLDQTFATFPLGPLVMVVPRGGTAPPPDAMLAMNEALVSRFRLEDPPPESHQGWAYLLQADYATPFLALARAFDTEGRPAEAKRCRERAAMLSPGTVR